MKTPALLLAMFAGTFAQAQDQPALRLWAETGRMGYITQAYAGAATIEELPLALQGRVSSLEVGAGWSVTLFHREDLAGPVSLEVNGPCRIDDLKTVPMMTFKGNWDDAIGSMRIAFSDPEQKRGMSPGVVAELRP